jgi:hypothetical protein
MPDDHWYISTFYIRDYVIIDYNIAYVVLAVKCRDIPMVVPRLYSGNVIVNDYLVPAVKCTFNSRDYVIIYYNIARIKTPDDHWYISTFYSRDYVIIDNNIGRIKTPDDHCVIVNDYVVPAVKCRDIPMVVPCLYSGNVIVNDYDDHWYIATFYSQDYVIMIITLPE